MAMANGDLFIGQIDALGQVAALDKYVKPASGDNIILARDARGQFVASKIIKPGNDDPVMLACDALGQEVAFKFAVKNWWCITKKCYDDFFCTNLLSTIHYALYSTTKPVLVTDCTGSGYKITAVDGPYATQAEAQAVCADSNNCGDLACLACPGLPPTLTITVSGAILCTDCRYNGADAWVKMRDNVGYNGSHSLPIISSSGSVCSYSLILGPMYFDYWYTRFGHTDCSGDPDETTTGTHTITVTVRRYSDTNWSISTMLLSFVGGFINYHTAHVACKEIWPFTVDNMNTPASCATFTNFLVGGTATVSAP